MTRNKVSDESNDTRYFTITPRLVWALSTDPYEYTLWCTIKMIAGDSGECFLSGVDLATLAMMSEGKAASCRAHLIECGLLEGEIRRDPGYPQPVWHLRVPDIWEQSVQWAEEFIKLSDRIAWKLKQKEAKKSPHPMRAKEPSPGEEGTSPGETKNIHKKNHKEIHLPERQPAPAEHLEEPEIVPVDSDGMPEFSEDLRIPKWSVPELDLHHRVLSTCHARRFHQTRQKSRLTGLSQAVKAGDVLGDGAYRACLDALDKCDNGQVQEPLPPIPSSWLDFRLEHAERHGWSVATTVDMLFTRDVLAQHCRYHMKDEVALEKDESFWVEEL